MGEPDWTNLLGCAPEEYCARAYGVRPGWISGHISFEDAKFLFARALGSGAGRIVEIGTASGLSTAILARAMHAARAAGRIPEDYRLDTYDIDARFYADKSHAAGDAAREMLPDELLAHVAFHAPCTAADVVRDHGPDSLAFAFVDAAHTHPWPAVDLLTLLPSLAPGAEVVLHDINLPGMGSPHADWGAKHLFDGLDLEKEVDEASDPPNVGSVRIPAEKDALREQLLAIVHRHEWETEMEPEVLAVAGVRAA